MFVKETFLLYGQEVFFGEKNLENIPYPQDISFLIYRALIENRAGTSPYFPMDRLKIHMMQALTEAVEKGAAHIRDPIGGSNANLFV